MNTMVVVVMKEIASYIADQPAADFGKFLHRVHGMRDYLFAGKVDMQLASVGHRTTGMEAAKPVA